MRPCDCLDMETAKKLDLIGTAHNGYKIELHPQSVIITYTNYSIKIPQIVFKHFSNWYLEDQEE